MYFAKRRSRKRRSRVFVMGAGASFADNIPVQSQILKTCFQLIEKDSTQYRNLKEFFRVFFNLDEPIFEQNLPKMEHLLGMLEMPEILDIDYPGYNAEKMIEFKRLIFGTVLKTLQSCRRDMDKSFNFKFVKRLRSIFSDFNDINFISMNYDTVLDDSLSQLDPEEKIDYGLDLVNFYTRYNSNFPMEKPMPGNTHLLKLHGSLSFRYCRVCQSIELVRPDKLSGTFEKTFCSIDGAPTETLVVPPSFFKNLKIPPLLQLWIKARLMLMDADEIYFIGYSLPLADVPVWQMLKSAELARPDKKVVIVDANGKENTETKKRYSQIFRNIQYLPIGFENFIDSMDEYF